MAELFDDLASGSVTKGGETKFWVTLGRSPRHPDGLTVSVKALPEVEAFMRALSIPQVTETDNEGNPIEPQPIVQDCILHGRSWIPVDKNVPLRVYALQSVVGGMQSARIDRPSSPLLIIGTNGDGDTLGSSLKRRTVNLSFLRLVGISEGSGVTFTVRGVYSDDQVIEIHKELLQGLREFWVKYMKPINMSIQLSTQEIT